MDEFLNQLRKQAIYFKLSSKEKHGGAVNAEDVIRVLKSLIASYSAYVEIEYDRINTLQDPKRLKKVRAGLAEENELLIVDLKFESFGVGIAPNTITHKHNIPSIKHPLEWKDNSFNGFKQLVLSKSFDDETILKAVESKYTPTERQRIFRPIIEEIALNKRIYTAIGFSPEGEKKNLVAPKESSYNILVPAASDYLAVSEEPVKRTSMARVEITQGITKPKVLNIFDEIQNPVWKFNKIEHEGTVYELKFPIFYELIQEEDGSYFLFNEQFGIHVYGKTLEEAQVNFAEEFDYIYNRYNDLPDSELTESVITIKKSLNLIVAKA